MTTKPSAEPVRLSAEAGFSAYAMESGFVDGWLVDAWVRGGQDQLGQVMGAAQLAGVPATRSGCRARLPGRARPPVPGRPERPGDGRAFAAPCRFSGRLPAAWGIGTFYADQNPLDAFDVIVHLPYVTAAKPHQAALARSSLDVREAFARWAPP